MSEPKYKSKRLYFALYFKPSHGSNFASLDLLYLNVKPTLRVFSISESVVHGPSTCKPALRIPYAGSVRNVQGGATRERGGPGRRTGAGCGAGPALVILSTDAMPRGRAGALQRLL